MAKAYKEFQPAFRIAGDRYIAVSGFFIVRQEAGNGIVRLFPPGGRITASETGQQQGRTLALLELNVLFDLYIIIIISIGGGIALCW